MFEIDVAGLAELEGGKPPYRLAFEPVVNVFDEFRGYDDGRKRPTFCKVDLRRNEQGRGVILAVEDDGAGFSNERDIWTFFGTTKKRLAARVAGRFNAGDKQLIALSRKATITSNAVTVVFENSERAVKRHRAPIVEGVRIEALLPWSLADMDFIRQQLQSVLPPAGLSYFVDGVLVETPSSRGTVNVTLPTVILADGVMRETSRKSAVAVIKQDTPRLYELGVPVLDLTDIGFPWSLDVGQKIPLPISRDSVSPAYLFRLIGCVVEQAAMDGIELLTPEEQGAGFVKGALDWVRNSDALKIAVSSLFGADAVRMSSDPIANIQATAAGSPLISGKWFTADTRRRLDEAKSLPTAKEVFGGSVPDRPDDDSPKCPACGRKY